MGKYDDPKKEFDRGYNFGKKDGVDELMKKILKSGGEYAEKFETHEVVIKIPREYFTILAKEAEATA